MALHTGTGRCAALLSTVAVAAGALTGCQSIADASASGCDGTESRVEKLESYGVLGSRPEGAIIPKGFEKLESDCWQDSGDAQLYASRTYVLRGDKAEVAAHYRTVAEQEGWKPARPDQGSSNDGQFAGLCFTRAEGDRATALDVYFLTKEILEAEERKPGPEFGSGSGYRVEITAAADGSPADCSD
ncbi:hypothetical protein OG927_31825 [Streptomyces clavifer]|uniref:hypothetical protein n=1 Tax=Streptomyces clavifer TaxID=68188 RepID=UPI002E812206|nr:hypothetical protein [Streptomyces clavifer]WUC31651.1 hypothetical protein OG927_31825 [Streptomyces clavifer]